MVSSHDMLQGSNVDRDSQNFIVYPSYLMLQVFQPCISLHIIHDSQIIQCVLLLQMLDGSSGSGERDLEVLLESGVAE